MANAFKYVDWVGMESLRLLLNKLQVAQFFNTDHEKEFNKEFAVGDTIRVKLPQRFITRDSLVYNPQAINRLNTTIVVDQIVGCDFEYDSIEAALKMERGKDQIRKQYLDPLTNQIAQDIDSRCANWVRKHANNHVGVLGTDPTTFKAISGGARQRMIELACPAGGEKGMIIPPRVNTELVSSAAAYFNPSGDISKQYKEGSIGRQGGFDWYESMSLYSHTAATWAAAVTVTTTVVDGASTLALTCTNGDTFKEGDSFTIADCYAVNPSTRRSTGSLKQFVVRSADQTISGTSVAALAISPTIYGPNHQYQNVSVLPVAGKALTLWNGTTSPNGKIGTIGAAIHRDAFALVGVKLEVPKAVEWAVQHQDPDTGLAFRIVRAWDQSQSKMTTRADTLFGFGDLYPDSCAVKVLSA